MRRLFAVLAAVFFFPLLPAPAAEAAPLGSTVWLCRPGMPANPCGQDARGNPLDQNLTGRYLLGGSTEFDARRADGTHEPFTVPADPPVDCFYVYPTVDLLPNPLLRLGSLPPVPQNNALAVTFAQAQRFAGQCRIFAPVYRQLTLLELAGGVLTGTSPDPSVGYGDVADAFADYWAHDNVDPATGKRRGVVLVGHSQGTAALAALMRTTFDVDAGMRGQLVAAYLLGGDVQVPVDGVKGGGGDPDSTFQNVPVCTREPGAPVPVGCVVAYSAFDLAEGGVPTSFGRSTAPGHRKACVNPAALLGGGAANARLPLDALMPTRRLVAGNSLAPGGHLALVMGGYPFPDLPAGFARYTESVTGACVSAVDGGVRVDWLQVEGDLSLFAADSRTHALGLHVVDVNVALGDLTALAGAQSAEWRGR
ncbi:DUF3089 domain-containing protein [Streptomyces sp. NPDC004539]|uniref:DUF3089 domain-containing protein n=1 Tax=Streptomyces sp. NPDC004539 TaxID=3154280 RepID=UPI0033BDE02F